jgi:HD superfamily phosphodiesterase
MTEKVILSMIEYFGNDVSRINHALKVYSFAQAISRAELLSQGETRVTEIAAILHDIGIPEAMKKYHSCIGTYQEMEGPPVARRILESLHVQPELCERVCHLIGNHHSYTKIDGIDFRILVEADFLVNIHEEKMKSDMIESIRRKYFKTKTGILILDTIYNN